MKKIRSKEYTRTTNFKFLQLYNKFISITLYAINLRNTNFIKKSNVITLIIYVT